MKRSAGLQRHKPLVGAIETHLAWQRRSRDAAIERARQVPSRPKDTGPSRKTRDLIRTERAKNHCEVSGRPLGTTEGHIHHRRPRRAGGDKRVDTNAPQNLLLVAPDVHDWIEDNRAVAHELGLLLHDKQNPLTEAVELHRGRVLLTELGGYEPADTNQDDPRGAAA